MLEPEEPELLPDLEDESDDPDLALVPVLDFAFVEEADEEVPLPVDVEDLLLLPDVEEDEEELGSFELEEPDFEDDDPELPILLPIDDEFEDPDVLSDILPEL